MKVRYVEDYYYREMVYYFDCAVFQVWVVWFIYSHYLLIRYRQYYIRQDSSDEFEKEIRYENDLVGKVLIVEWCSLGFVVGCIINKHSLVNETITRYLTF